MAPKGKRAAGASVAEQVDDAMKHLGIDKPKGKKQLPIPGTERKGLKEVDHAAEAYVEARDERMKRTEDEVATRDALIRALKKHGVESYRDDEADPPLIITLIPGEDRVKVTRATADAGDEGSDG